MWEYSTKFPSELAQRSQMLLQSPADLHRALSYFIIWWSYKSHLVASWVHLQYYWCFHEYWRIVLQSTRSLSLALGGLEGFRSTWKHWWGWPECLGCFHEASRPIYIFLIQCHIPGRHWFLFFSVSGYNTLDGFTEQNLAFADAWWQELHQVLQISWHPTEKSQANTLCHSGTMDDTY